MSQGPPSIRIPLQQRWHDLRMRVLPLAVFGTALVSIVALWKDYVAAPTLVGQAEPVLADVSSPKPGVLAELNVTRFRQVKAGEVVGKVLIADPKIVASTLAVIEAEIKSLSASMKPVAAQQRNAMDYDQLRLDWMRQRAQLASAKVNRDLAESEFHRMDELFKERIVAARLHEEAKANLDRLQGEVDVLTKLVSDCETHLNNLQITNAVELSKVSLDPLQAEIAVQEAKLAQAVAEMSPVLLTAPIDGIVTRIDHRTGEAVTPGKPIVAIATLNAVRIVGYLRPPLCDQAKVGMTAQVRTRGLPRQIGTSLVRVIGSQLEPIPPPLLGPIKLASAELGLPIEFEMPANLAIRPGELVDLILTAKAD